MVQKINYRSPCKCNLMLTTVWKYDTHNGIMFSKVIHCCEQCGAPLRKRPCSVIEHCTLMFIFSVNVVHYSLLMPEVSKFYRHKLLMCVDTEQCCMLWLPNKLHIISFIDSLLCNASSSFHVEHMSICTNHSPSLQFASD